MYVCVCHAVSDRTIRDAARRGVNSVDALAAETGLGSCCGSCRPLALEILQEHRTPALNHPRHGLNLAVPA